MSRFAFTCSRHTSCSPIHASPLVGRTRVVRTPTAVDLPAPLGPSNPKISPGRISNETPSSAVISNFLAAFFCFFLGPLNIAPVAAIGGGEVYTLRRSTVRIPIGIRALSLFLCQFWPFLKSRPSSGTCPIEEKLPNTEERSKGGLLDQVGENNSTPGKRDQSSSVTYFPSC